MSASVSGWWDDFQNLFDEKKAPPPSSTKIEDLSRASYPPRSPGSHPHDGTMFGVGLELCPGELTVDALTPGCSAEKSGSVVAGDEIIAVDGAENLTVQHAKQLMMGRQGSYATVTFRRQEANAMRSFKVQLMRGAADYIFLVEALRSLETQNARLTKENERLRANQGDPNQTRNDQERIRELLESNEELYGQIKSYKGKLSTAEDEIMRLRYQQDELAAQSKKVVELKRRNAECEGENDALRRSIKELDRERHEEKLQTRKVERTCKELEEEVEELRRQLAIEPDTSEYDAEIKRLNDRIVTLEQTASEVRNLKGMVLNRNNRIQMLEEEIDEIRRNPPVQIVREIVQQPAQQIVEVREEPIQLASMVHEPVIMASPVSNVVSSPGIVNLTSGFPAVSSSNIITEVSPSAGLASIGGVGGLASIKPMNLGNAGFLTTKF